jgi:hypothetical protein
MDLSLIFHFLSLSSKGLHLFWRRSAIRLRVAYYNAEYYTMQSKAGSRFERELTVDRLSIFSYFIHSIN